VDRRSFLQQIAAIGFVLGNVRAGTAQTLLPQGKNVRDHVRERAKTLSRNTYVEPDSALPDRLQELGYDEYNQIQFRSERGIWRNDDARFELHLFHRGFLFKDRVAVFLAEGDTIQPLVYDPNLFGFGLLEDIGQNQFGDIGFAGIRLLYPINDPEIPQEFLVFLGASYFRAVAKGQVYGLSARGLALRTADEQPEEFPYFNEIYVERPDPGSGIIAVHALLDSPSVSGAYSFQIRPGEQTRMEVDAVLFPRNDLDHVGLAPLTSMYQFGPLERPDVDDFRPRVHDSDGLLIRSQTEEWLWRPLANPERLQVSSFQVGDVRGFGLAQRSRNPEDYQDLEAKYHRRPSLWVEPLSGWPPGAVDLIEIPTPSEFNDNIVWTCLAFVESVFDSTRPVSRTEAG